MSPQIFAKKFPKDCVNRRNACKNERKSPKNQTLQKYWYRICRWAHVDQQQNYLRVAVLDEKSIVLFCLYIKNEEILVTNVTEVK